MSQQIVPRYVGPLAVEAMSYEQQLARARALRDKFLPQARPAAARPVGPGPMPSPPAPNPDELELRAKFAEAEGQFNSAVFGEKPSPKQIIAAVAQEHGLAAADLIGQSRERTVTRARFAAMAAVKAAHPAMSTTRIGRVFGNRDHTTVVNALRRHALGYKKPPDQLADRIREINPDNALTISQVAQALGITPHQAKYALADAERRALKVARAHERWQDPDYRAAYYARRAILRAAKGDGRSKQQKCRDAALVRRRDANGHFLPIESAP